jgi:hypothetical protein
MEYRRRLFDLRNRNLKLCLSGIACEVLSLLPSSASAASPPCWQGHRQLWHAGDSAPAPATRAADQL